MRQCTVEQSTVIYRSTFAQMLPWLPIPGNKGFATLSKGLSKYGLSPASLEIEAPTNRLDDFLLVISLLTDRVKLKLSWGWFEFLVSNLYEDDEPSIIEIADVVLATLAEIDSEMEQSIGRYQSYTHLKMDPPEVEDLLRENLRGNGSADLVADAFAYQLKWKEFKDGESARIVIARSLRVDGGLFADLTINYVSPDDPAKMVERMNQDYGRALSLLGLTIG